jgi:hypothetical protein
MQEYPQTLDSIVQNLVTRNLCNPGLHCVSNELRIHMGKKNIVRPRKRRNVKLAVDLLHPSVNPRERAKG